MRTLSQKPRIIFMGTPDFAVPALRALVSAGHEVVAVYCQPARAAGRGQHIQKTPVHLVAEELNIPVSTPANFKNNDDIQFFKNLNADLAIVAAYGLILPKAILDAPTFGCINIHASLLPRWRGAAPIHRALLAGDGQTGITIMQMDVGLDTGAMLMQTPIPILSTSTTSELHDALAQLGGNMMAQIITGLQNNSIVAAPQPKDGVTYAAKLNKNEGCIDWQEEAALIERKIRALYPWPGAWFETLGEKIKIYKAEFVMDQQGTSGTILDDQFTVACGSEALRLLVVQRPGRAAIDGAAFLRGFGKKPGDRL
jgi:methionyl-tRNA formyltransferase